MVTTALSPIEPCLIFPLARCEGTVSLCEIRALRRASTRHRRQIQPSSFFSLNDASMRAREPLTWSIGLALLRAGVARTS